MTAGPDAVRPDERSESTFPDVQPARSPSRTPTIADPYADLLRPLNERQRRAIVLRLTFGFYEGWRPGRTEMADLVAVELGTLSTEDALRRQQHRTLRATPDRDPGGVVKPTGSSGAVLK
jgi:hypothetical protein